MSSEGADGWKRGDPIGYTRGQIPNFDVAGYGGERYEAMVPDTLDLQERAAMSVNCLTRCTAPEADYEIYTWVHLGYNPPMMQHDWHDRFHRSCRTSTSSPGSPHCFIWSARLIQR